MEIAPPMVDLQKFLELSAWGKVYSEHFPERAKTGSRKNSPPPSAALARAGAGKKAAAKKGARAIPKAVRALAAKLGLEPNAQGMYVLPQVIKVLEIFCGPNHNVINALESSALTRSCCRSCPPGTRNRWTTYDPRYNPTILTDIKKWKPLETFSKGEFAFIWCSIPCPAYSIAATSLSRKARNRKVRAADAVGRAAVQAILALKPKLFAIENPTGDKRYGLRTRRYMKPFLKFLKPTTYCHFDDFPYRKETDIFTNAPVWLPHCRLQNCAYKAKHRKHRLTAQCGASKNGTPGAPTEVLYRVPYGLIQDVFAAGFTSQHALVEKYLPEDLPPAEAAELRDCVYGKGKRA